MSHVFHRHTRRDFPVANRGDGPYVVDTTGKRYLDASGGAAVSCLGHSHHDIVDAIKEQVSRLAFAHTGFFTNEKLEQLAEMLITLAPGDLARVYFVSGGSEAVEAALKLARQYFLESGEPDRQYFIARRQSYHGNTLGALAVGGNAWRREPFRPLLADTYHVSACYAYRDQRADESDSDYVRRLGDELEQTILEIGPEKVAAFVAEPVVGATLGAVPPVDGYFRLVREICDRYGVLLILDEVMCGMGRTGTLFACEQDGVSGDLIAIAKGLGAGYQPIGALLVSEAIYDAIYQGSGFFQHGHTYMGHPVACAAAVAVLSVIQRDGLLGKVVERGHQLTRALEHRFGDHPNVGDIRGRGLFLGLELVRDRDHKTPFDPSFSLHGRVKAEAMARGLMCYPMGGTVDGMHGDHVLLAPPFLIDEAHIEEITDSLDAAIAAALRGIS